MRPSSSIIWGWEGARAQEDRALVQQAQSPVLNTSQEARMCSTELLGANQPRLPGSAYKLGKVGQLWSDPPPTGHPQLLPRELQPGLCPALYYSFWNVHLGPSFQLLFSARQVRPWTGHVTTRLGAQDSVCPQGRSLASRSGLFGSWALWSKVVCQVGVSWIDRKLTGQKLFNNSTFSQPNYEPFDSGGLVSGLGG